MKIRSAKSEISALYHQADRFEPVTPLTTQTSGDYFPPTSVAREGTQPTQTSKLDFPLQETTSSEITTDDLLFAPSNPRVQNTTITTRVGPNPPQQQQYTWVPTRAECINTLVHNNTPSTCSFQHPSNFRRRARSKTWARRCPRNPQLTRPNSIKSRSSPLRIGDRKLY